MLIWQRRCFEYSVLQKGDKSAARRNALELHRSTNPDEFRKRTKWNETPDTKIASHPWHRPMVGRNITVTYVSSRSEQFVQRRW